MKRKSMLALLLAVSMTCSMTAATGTVAFASDDAATEEAADDTEAAADDADAADTEKASDDTTEASDDDQKAADEVGALIDKIYVQERTDTTDEDCKAAKEAWDKLTDAQKELVTGEEASPEYFGRDTGDASKDDPRNQDEIGENELLVVSFGTSFNDSRAEDIKGIEDALQEAYPDWSVRRAFTAQIIINHVQARDGEAIDNMDQALDRAVANGVKNLVVQPTHLMHGAEYDELCGKCSSYRPVRICFLKGILDTFDISYTAVIEGSSEACHQNLVLTDLILIAGIILGSISGISAEIIGICIFSLYQFLLCVGQCIPCCLGICTLLIGILSSLLHIDGIDQCCYFIGCCLIYIFGAFGSCCFRCLGGLRLSAYLCSAFYSCLGITASGDAYSTQYGCQYYCYDSFFHVSSSDRSSVSFDFGACPGILKYVSQKHVL